LTYGNHIEDENLSLYAVRALGQTENGDVQLHLDTCVTCRGRLAEIIGGLSVAALTAPQEPRVYDAHERIISRIKAEEDVVLPVDSESITTPDARASALSSSRNLFSGFAWVAAAIAIAAALSIGSKEHALQQQLAAQREQIVQLTKQSVHAQQVLDLLNSHSAQRLLLTEARNVERATAHVIYDKDRAALIFIANKLSPVPADKAYELWLVPAGDMPPISLQVFRPDTDGSANVVLPTLPIGINAKTFNVTVEEAQGSTSPTVPFVLSSW
jgi:Anti-sigma-K factor rskA, C-terminal